MRRVSLLNLETHNTLWKKKKDTHRERARALSVRKSRYIYTYIYKTERSVLSSLWHARRISCAHDKKRRRKKV